MSLRAVLFDWRGTLVVPLSPLAWVREGLVLAGRDPGGARQVLAAVEAADGGRLDAPGVDADAALHRETYARVLADAGLDDELAGALYAVESDLSRDVFASDAAPVLRALAGARVPVAVVSDLHVDVRPAFAAAGLADLVAVFTLSFEQGVQKPDPAVFLGTLDALGVAPADALMVGDRSRPDGGAVEVGLVTLLLPPLTDPAQRRLGHVLALCGLR